MDSYLIDYTSRAGRALRNIKTPGVPQKIIQKIDALINDPLPNGVLKVVSMSCDFPSPDSAVYRIRHADYRIFYGVDHKNKIVQIIDIQHRSDAY